MNPGSAPLPVHELYARFVELRASQAMRHRDAARALGTTEGEAIAAAIGTTGPLRAVRLAGPWPDLFQRLTGVGEVMALTRNEGAVHEKVGHFADMSHQGHVGLALGNPEGTALDLRIFYTQWAHVFALSEDTTSGVQRSLQVFDRHGHALHKVFLRAASNLEAWLDFLELHADTDQYAGIAVVAPDPREPATPDAAVPVEDFHWAWRSMLDTHEFFPLLRKFKLGRTQALRLAEPAFATRVDPGALRAMLDAASRDRLSIMCFVGNPGMIQIHTGPVERVEVMGPWLNVLDPRFNLHLREDLVDQAWVVRKPTSDGIVTSLEAFDAQGETIAMFFGERKPGKPELAAWRSLAEQVATRHARAAGAEATLADGAHSASETPGAHAAVLPA